MNGQAAGGCGAAAKGDESGRTNRAQKCDEFAVLFRAYSLHVWIGPAGFLTCLWALEDYREWSFRLAGPAFAPLAERFFLALSQRRRALAFLFEPKCTDGTCSLGR